MTLVRGLAAHLPEAGVAEGTPAAAALAILGERGGADAGMSRTTLYRGVVDLLALVHTTAPLAVLLDDAHWVDADTLTLLALAVDELAARGVIFAVAVRSDEPGAADVHELVGRLPRDLVTGVALRRLHRAEVGELVRGLTGVEPEPAVVDAIAGRTAGNPLFAGEVVRLLSSERRLDTASVHTALPEHVRDVLRRRLDRLPGQTVALLTVVALAGGPADVDLLAGVTGLDADAVLDGCESALLAELLVEDQEGFLLSHDLVRQTLEEDLSGARRIRLHAKLAATLQAGSELTPQQVLDVARHLRIAASIVGPEAAVPYLLAASDDALSRYAHGRGEELLLEALDLIAAVRDPARRAALESPVRGRLDTVRTWTRGVLTEPVGPHAVWPLPTDPDATAGWIGNLIISSVTGCYGRAAAVAEGALAADLPPIGRLGAHFVAGWADFMLGRLDASERHLRTVEALMAEDPGLRIPGAISTVEVSTAGYAALIAHINGDEVAADRAMALAEVRAADRAEPNRINVDLHHAWLAAMRGNAERTRLHARRCIVSSERFSFPIFGLHAGVLAGWAGTLLGEPDGPAQLDAAYATYRASGLRLFDPFYLLLRAEAAASAGDRAAAADLIAEAGTASRELNDVCLSPRLIAFSNGMQALRKA